MSKRDWTILVYIAAHNDLHKMGERSLQQLFSLGSNADVMLTALYDGPAGAKRYVIGPPGKAQDVVETQKFDSGDPAHLAHVANWAFATYPADNFGLVLWSHGTGWAPGHERGAAGAGGATGWSEAELLRIAQTAGGDVATAEASFRAHSATRPALFRSTLKTLLGERAPIERAICFDDGSQHSLDTVALAEVLKSVEALIKKPIDLLGMDACLMGSLEVAYEVRKHARYMVASSELVPGTSWPYDKIFAGMKGVRPPALAKRILKEYAAHYREYFPGLNGGDVTKVALDLSRLDGLTGAVGALADEMRANVAQHKNALWRAQEGTQAIESLQGMRWHSKFEFHLWDIGSVARHIHQNSSGALAAAAKAVLDELKPGHGAILDEMHQGNWLNDIGGLTVYLPPLNVSGISKHYDKVAFAGDAHWHALLRAYHGLKP